MNQNLQREYFLCCDLHNNALMLGNTTEADKHYWRSAGFLDAVDAMGGNVGELLIQADRYVSAKFSQRVELCGGRLLSRPKETTIGT